MVDDGTTLLVSGHAPWGKRPSQPGHSEEWTPTPKKHKVDHRPYRQNPRQESPAEPSPSQYYWEGKGDKGGKGKGKNDDKGKGKGKDDEGKGKGKYDDKGKGKGDKGKGKSKSG